jgi:hypothetical protein
METLPKDATVRSDSSTVTTKLLRIIGFEPKWISFPEEYVVHNGSVMNIDAERVLYTDIDSKHFRAIMENLDEPVVILDEKSGGLLREKSKKRALSHKDLVTAGAWVLVPQKAVGMGGLKPSVYFASNPDTQITSILLTKKVESAIGGGFEVNTLPSDRLNEALNKYMNEKRPSGIGLLMKKLNREKENKVIKEEISDTDVVGFSPDSLTPALLYKVINLYAEIVPGANIELITSMSKMESLREEISTAFRLEGGIEPRLGSMFTRHSKLLLVQVGKGANYADIYSFDFKPNLEYKLEENSEDVKAVVNRFSEAMRNLLIDWRIAKKVRKLPQ